MIEAAIADLRSHHLVQGASTMTQQLARTFIERHERSLRARCAKLAVALVIEMRLSKNEILERYINDVPMGEYRRHADLRDAAGGALFLQQGPARGHAGRGRDA